MNVLMNPHTSETEAYGWLIGLVICMWLVHLGIRCTARALMTAVNKLHVATKEEGSRITSEIPQTI